MSLRLPPLDHTAREFFEVEQLVEMTTGRDWSLNFPGFGEARRSARRTMAEYQAGGIKAVSIQSLCMRANGEIWLIRTGPRGGWKKLWNFGQR